MIDPIVLISLCTPSAIVSPVSVVHAGLVAVFAVSAEILDHPFAGVTVTAAKIWTAPKIRNSMTTADHKNRLYLLYTPR